MARYLSYRGYRGTVQLDTEANTFFGKIADIETLVFYHGDTLTVLQENFAAAVEDYLQTFAAMGRQPERPFPRPA